jgi:glucose/arabinose dehydrogenase
MRLYYQKPPVPMPNAHLKLEISVKTVLLLVLISLIGACSRLSADKDRTPRFVSTIAGANGEFGETFGVAIKDGNIYVSDGQNGTIWKLHEGQASAFASGLDTPSGIAFSPDGSLIVADPGSSTIKSIDVSGEVKTIAGTAGRHGFADGDAVTASFNAPVAVAIGPDGKIYVADTYNDRIRVIENGRVSTLAGGTRGFADGVGQAAKFDTPCGIGVWQDKLLVADTGNRRIRVVEPNGDVWTLAGTGESDLKDGGASQANFVRPIGIAVDQNGVILISDGDSIREISGLFPIVRTISASSRGLSDGSLPRARFNSPVGIAVASDGSVIVADSANRLVRKLAPDQGTEITADQKAALRGTAEQFRQAAPARWPYDPPTAKRDIAGTLGEIRGDTTIDPNNLHFHNGLDIAGSYGETARFVRDEKVLSPTATELFGDLRENIRMPTMGYIHIRLGRDKDQKPFGDPRFQFTTDASGKLIDVRVPRGSAFKAGEPIGTLNPFNHVHLIAGRLGSEMNALDALILPGIADTRPPVIEKVTFFNGDTEIKSTGGKTQISGRIRIVAQAYDQVDGNAARRRLGLYQAGYQILRPDKTPMGDIQWNIRFDRMPRSGAVPFVYATGSKSGATGETIFDYIVTNHVEGDDYSEGFLDTSSLEAGNYIVRVWAGDYFGNNSYVDTPVEVKR